MKKHLLSAGIITLLVSTAFAREVDIEMKPMHFGIWSAYGHLHGDSIASFQGFEKEMEGQATTRITAWAEFGTVVDERLFLKAVLFGHYWYSVPASPSAPWEYYKNGGAGLDEAVATYRFGDIEKPVFQLHAGLMKHKYSPNSNLGEYLYRSVTYPGIIVANDWELIKCGEPRAEQGAAYYREVEGREHEASLGGWKSQYLLHVEGAEQHGRGRGRGEYERDEVRPE